MKLRLPVADMDELAVDCQPAWILGGMIGESPDGVVEFCGT